MSDPQSDPTAGFVSATDVDAAAMSEDYASGDDHVTATEEHVAPSQVAESEDAGPVGQPADAEVGDSLDEHGRTAVPESAEGSGNQRRVRTARLFPALAFKDALGLAVAIQK